MKLTKKEIEAKKKMHENKVKYYDKKLQEIEKDEMKIGFRYK